MNNKKIYFLLTAVLVAGFFFNSCKKEKQSSIPSLFTYGTWRLTSIQEATYLGGSRLTLDTIPINTIQTFAFNDDRTCAYTNFDDKEDTVNGTWALSDTQLYLFANITFPYTTTAKTNQPFINSHIISLGEFSMVIEAGDIQTYYSPTDSRTIRTYGFVRIKPDGTQ
nr:hypothetical protein [Mucilaginibacter sp. L294]